MTLPERLSWSWIELDGPIERLSEDKSRSPEVHWGVPLTGVTMFEGERPLKTMGFAQVSVERAVDMASPARIGRYFMN